MRKNAYLKLIAIFLSTLVVMLPLCSAKVTAQDVPTLTVQVIDSVIVLSWSLSGTFEIYRSNAPITTISGLQALGSTSMTSYVDTGVEAGTEYYYAIVKQGEDTIEDGKNSQGPFSIGGGGSSESGADATRGEMTVVFSGEDEVDGFRKTANDRYVAVATASIQGDNTITKNQIKFCRNCGTTDCLEFNEECVSSSQSGFFKCKYTSIKDGISYKDWCIRAFNDNGDVIEDMDTQVSIKVDDNAPKINSYSIAQNSENLTVNFNVQDQATDGCSGIKDVEFYIEDGETLDIVDVNQSVGSCGEITKTNYPIPAPQRDGDINICLEAYDNIGNSFKKCEEVSVDSVSPVVEEVKLFTSGDNVLTYTSNQVIEDVILEITIKESNDLFSGNSLDTGNAIRVDLTELNVDPSVMFQYEDISIACNKKQDFLTSKLWVCRSAGQIDVYKPGGGTANIKIKGKDSSQNTLDETKGISLTAAPSGPQLVFIGTDKCKGDICYVSKEDNTIVARFEGGAGFETTKNFRVGGGGTAPGKTVFALIGNLNSQFSSPYAMHNCSMTGDQWECSLYNFDVGSITDYQDFKIQLSPLTEDDAGNGFSQPNDLNEYVTSDFTAPTMINLSVLTSDEFDFFKTGDSIKIISYIEDNGTIDTAIVDLHDLYVGGHDTEAGDCSKVDDEGIWKCSWDATVEKTGVYKAKLNFSYKDVAGNELLNETEIQVFIKDDSTVPNSFNVIVHNEGITPRQVSRLTLSFMPNPPGVLLTVPFYLYRSGGGSTIKVLYEEMDSCSIVSNSTGINDTTLIWSDMFTLPPTSTTNSKVSGSVKLARPRTDPGESNKNRARFIFAELEDEVINELTDFEIECKLKTYQRIGNKIYTQPEVDNVTISIELRSAALGEMGDKAIEKIKDAQDHPIVKADTLMDTLVITLNTIESFCNLMQWIAGFEALGTSVEGIGMVLEKVPITSVVGKAVVKIGRLVKELAQQFVKKFYAFSIPGTDFSLRTFCNYASCSASQTLAEKMGLGDVPFFAGSKESGWGWTEAGSGLIGKLANKLNDPSSCGAWGGDCKDSECEGVYDNIKTASWLKPKQKAEVSKHRLCDARKTCCVSQATLQDPTGGWAKGLSDQASAANSSSISVTNSFFWSVATLCLKGIITHVDNYRNIQCTYINCLKESSIQGISLSTCEAKKSSAVCFVIVGEVFEIFGVVRMIKYFSNQVKSIVAGFPMLLLNKAFTAMCDGLKNVEYARWIFCDVPQAIDDSINVWNTIKNIPATAKGNIEAFKNFGTENCDQALCNDIWDAEKKECVTS